jgi:FixJ family two-component response regulator
MSTAKNKTVWVVDDEIELAESLVDQIASRDRHVKMFTSPIAALRALPLSEVPPDIVVTDLRMPEMDGFKFVGSIREKNITAPVILLSGCLGRQELLHAQQLGITGVLEKPVDEVRLNREVERVFDARATPSIDAQLVTTLRARVKKLEEGWELRGQLVRDLLELVKEVDNELYYQLVELPSTMNKVEREQQLIRQFDELESKINHLWSRSRLSD